MATNNSSNQAYKNNTDGWELAGGQTKRKLTVNSGDITLQGGNSNTYTFPSSGGTLALEDNTSVNGQTGMSYTFVMSDKNAIVTADNSSAQTYTVPTNSSVAFPVGTKLIVAQLGTGAVTVSGDTGVTVNGASGGSVTSNQHQMVVLHKIGTDAWQAEIRSASQMAIDTDGTLAANSDDKVASQKAVKTYVDSQSSTYIYHDWDTSDSSVWNPVWISAPQYGTQQFPTIQAVNHRGRMQTSNSTDNESTREVFLRAGTNWYNSEIHSIWYGNSPFLELQILSMSGATGGTYTLTYSGQTTSALAYNASASDIQTALAALSNIGAGNVEVGVQNQNTMPNGILTIHFIGSLAGKQCMLLKATSSLTGTSPTVKVTSPYIPQMGHMHRAYDTGSGNYTSIMLDNNVIYQLYSQLNLQAWGFNGALTQGSPRGNMTSPTPTWNIIGYQRWNFGVYIHDYQVNDVSGLRKGMSIKVSGCTDTSFNGNFVIADINQTQGYIRAMCTNSATQNNVVAWQAEAYPAASVVGATNMTTDGLDWTTAWSDNPVSFFPYHVRTAVYDNSMYVKLWRVNEKEPDKGIITSVQSSYDFSGETAVLPITEGNPGYCGLIANHLYGGAYMEYGNVEFKKL